MPTRPKYWLDADVFIQASRKWYKFDSVPRFWVFMDEQLEAGTIRCPKLVFDDLIKGTDHLATWVKARKQNGLCVPLSEDVFTEYNKIVDYINESGHLPHQANEFYAASDGWLIAYAMAHHGIVVTQESSSRKKKIRIPTVCTNFRIRHVDTPRMLDELGF
jgi:hypothetical protein